MEESHLETCKDSSRPERLNDNDRAQPQTHSDPREMPWKGGGSLSFHQVSDEKLYSSGAKCARNALEIPQVQTVQERQHPTAS